ncbi:hypothetical protein SEPCBS119000_004457 [Sporothrix epigloea]|uniref:Cyclin-D1-binding protein 1-like N-terminal domain-containing protein n=1 Tax=Sporothrix epigloea TaxID=1892477 RepID=A0ABP0DVZ3_9PEZI
MASSGKQPDSSAVEALNKTVDAAVRVIEAVLKLACDAYEDAKTSKLAIASASGADALATLPAASSTPAAWEPPTELDAFALARDAAMLIRAHGTKISLLIINEPFTPSAIGKVVKELDRVVLSLGTAAQQCYGDRYTNHVRQEMARRCMGVLEKTRSLLHAIPRDGRVVPEAQRTGGVGTRSSSQQRSEGAAGRGSFTTIGILWAECDGLVAFCKGGVNGFLVQVVSQLAEQLKDEQEELREWGDEEGEGSDEDSDESDDGDVSDSGYDDGEDALQGNDNDATQAMLDALMNTRHIPPNDPNGLRPRLETVIKKIQLLLLLCRAVIKRRLTKPALPTLPLPTQEGQVAARLDGALVALQTTANLFEDLANAFYKLDVAEVDTIMGQCFDGAVSVSRQLSRPFMPASGTSSDLFTAWADKFESEIRVIA